MPRIHMSVDGPPAGEGPLVGRAMELGELRAALAMAAIYGLASIVFTRFPGTNVSYPGSKGIGWGIAALIGGLAFVVAGGWEARPPQRGRLRRWSPAADRSEATPTERREATTLSRPADSQG
jgi:hypothetical protein